ncbi:MAG: PIN domain-containing protein [Candidatus Acidiferrum sp.]
MERFLVRHDKVALDTSVFVYQLEAHPKYLPLTRAIFAWLETPDHFGVTSTITMTELLVKPYRDRDKQRVDNCFALFSRFPNLEWVAPNLDITDAAARIRAEWRLKTPDAIEAATAIYCGISGFLSNDSAFHRVPKLDALVLEDLL